MLSGLSTVKRKRNIAGDSLLNANDFNLEVSYVQTTLSFDAATGCTVVPGNVDYAAARAAEAVSHLEVVAASEDTVKRINGVTIATLVLAAVTLALALFNAASTSVLCARSKAPQAAYGAAVKGGVSA